MQEETLTLEQVDVDGAIRETAEQAAGLKKSDIAILNFALTLEYLEAAFYTEAERMGGFHGELGTFNRVVAGHERTHVHALKQVLGHHAVKRPTFDFHGTTESARKFKATAQVLEDTGVTAYKGQAPRIKSDAVLAAALSIHTVEARHASWIRAINGASPAPHAFDQPASMKKVLAEVAATHFIVTARRRTRRSGTPPFTG